MSDWVSDRMGLIPFWKGNAWNYETVVISHEFDKIYFYFYTQLVVHEFIITNDS